MISISWPSGQSRLEFGTSYYILLYNIDYELWQWGYYRPGAKIQWDTEWHQSAIGAKIAALKSGEIAEPMELAI